MNQTYIIEGLDRLGKSTLIEGILQAQGFRQVIHYSKPQKLAYYAELAETDEAKAAGYTAAYMYQHDGFMAMFEIIASGAPLILDRAHLGECVYAPLFRGYHGDYVFELEKEYGMDSRDDVRLILLTEDFEHAKHFVDDGESLGDETTREVEQQLFIDAFNKSVFTNKKIICVTDPSTGKFRSKEEILADALT